MIGIVHRHIVPAAYAVLPVRMTSPAATAMLLAIALQESGARVRHQTPAGPARGFWQFEAGGGVYGVQHHPRTAAALETALVALCYPPQMGQFLLHGIIEHNDVLACVLARLLLYTLPAALPGPNGAPAGWVQYVELWRPGRPHPETWSGFYATAWAMVSSEWET
jgi:hypothetical protein